MSIFFKQSIFGLDISDFSIEVLQLSSKEKIKKFGRIIIEGGIVKDGFILNKKKLVEKIKQVLSQAKIKENRVILALPESKIFIHLFQLPSGFKEKELRNALESEIQKTIPFEPEKIYWDYQIVSSKLGNGQQAILFVGTLKEIVDDYMEVLDEVGLEPVVFETESISLSRALLKDVKLRAGVMIVDIGAKTTNINIFDKNKILIDSTTIFIAGNHFTKSISNKLGVSSREAEKLKRIYGFDKKKGKGKTAQVLEEDFQVIIKKIKKSIGYYGQEIEKVILAGGSARMPKITKHLSLSLGLKVEVGIASQANQLKRKSVLFNNVIGLALRGLANNPQKSGINLLPEEFRPKYSVVSKKTRKKKFFPYLVTVILIIGLIFLGWTVYNSFVKNSLEQNPPINPFPTEEEATSVEEEIIPEESGEEQTTSQQEQEQEEKPISIIIQETETGWLNVREGPGTGYSVLTKVYPGESYPLLAEEESWYKIRLADKEGWILIWYATKSEEF